MLLKSIEYCRISQCLASINIILSTSKANACRADGDKILVFNSPPTNEVPVSAVHAMLVFFRA
jgi:hypothetical protein